MIGIRLGRLASALCAAAAFTACIDKETPMQTTSASGLVRFQLVTSQRKALAAARTVEVDVGYRQRDGKRISLSHRSVSASPGTNAEVAVTVDVGECLADANREGEATSCPLRIAVSLRDSASVALDSVEVGPVAAAPGQIPQLSTIELAADRFAVLQWAGDEALRLGGPSTPYGVTAGTSGYVGGGASPSIYSAIVAPSGNPALVVFQNGAWQRIVSTIPAGTIFYGVAPVSPTEAWIAASTGLYRYDGA
ncbi:MAG TPA: hypothetical protein VIP11_00840, partial [Gemmatimonadaceae bacterium]